MDKESHVFDFHMTLPYENERIFAFHQSYVDVYSIQHHSILKTQVEVLSSNHEDLPTTHGPHLSTLETFLQLMIIHVFGSVFVPQGSSQVRFFGCRSVTE